MRVTHGFVHQEIITLINEAHRVLILVSPYLDPWPGLITAIERARIRGVAIFLILRGGTDHEKHAAAAAPLRPFLQSLLFIERLHAKIYLSDKAAVLTSMNLVETSALNSIEFAVTVTKQLHPDGYQQAFSVCESLIATAEQDRQRGVAGRSNSQSTSDRERPPKKRDSVARRAGFCIRCGCEVALNPEKPLCADCYKIWSKYEDEDYQEEHCHHCRHKAATSMRKPLCRGCYEAVA